MRTGHYEEILRKVFWGRVSFNKGVCEWLCIKELIEFDREEGFEREKERKIV